MKIYIAILSASLVSLYGCAVDSSNSDLKSEKINSKGLVQANKKVIDIESDPGCWNFLNGKAFYSDKARLEFNSSGNAYVYNLKDNQIVFAGAVSLSPYFKGIRNIKIRDTMGSNQVINLSLSSMGELIDLSDFTVYQTK